MLKQQLVAMLIASWMLGAGPTAAAATNEAAITDAITKARDTCVLLPSGKPTSHFALVSAVANYTDPGLALRNPVSDATALTRSFHKLGFDVFVIVDFSAQGLSACLDQIRDTGKAWEVGAFHYSGHAIQVGDTNYMVSVDYDRTASDPTSGLFPLQQVIDTISASSLSRLIFLDACRDNPFLKSDSPGLSVSSGRSLGRGLEPSKDVDASGAVQARGTLIAYSTSPNSVAADGDGDNSPFSQALSEFLGKPGFSVQKAMAAVTNHVGETTDWRQTPWIRSSLTSELFVGSALSVEQVVASSEDHAFRSSEFLGRGMKREAIIEAYKGLPPDFSESDLPRFGKAFDALREAIITNTFYIDSDRPSSYAIISPDQRLAFVRFDKPDATSTLELWDVEDRRKLAETGTSTPQEFALRAIFSPDSSRLAFINETGMLEIWDTRAAERLVANRIYKLDDWDKPIPAVRRFSSDSRLLLLGRGSGADSGLKMLDTATGDLLGEITYGQVAGTRDKTFARAARLYGDFSADGNSIGIMAALILPDASAKTVIGRYDIATGELGPLTTLLPHAVNLNEMEFSPDLATLAFQHYDNGSAIHEIWAVEEPRKITELSNTNSGAYYSFNPANPAQLLFATSADAVLIDTQTGAISKLDAIQSTTPNNHNFLYTNNGVQWVPDLYYLDYWAERPTLDTFESFLTGVVGPEKRAALQSERIVMPR
jgi:hypothetical protein